MSLPIVSVEDEKQKIHNRKLLGNGHVIEVTNERGESSFDIVRKIRKEINNKKNKKSKTIDKILWCEVDRTIVVETFNGIIRGDMIRPLVN